VPNQVDISECAGFAVAEESLVHAKKISLAKFSTEKPSKPEDKRITAQEGAAHTLMAFEVALAAMKS
jgi:hypothetical protein